ncbi:PIG-L family deacetylase [Kribbella sandramycini]|uniref:LmbE family N-acetylglucosaminyl deacetylase n=1 Tax=Kribbella sandramycini TaxID=60450 RepID=A0A7Y4NXH2_9ACTN|nr:PIG-L deacetylase family protein [Kribbella sandramycini]MBB6567506.1 LmbE family N-acetylglucosaminyl deacetylase [Kribbella sandramycini]NOL39887.1 PIG-L family deacetylase [Kribbella sandramycini]
MNAVEGLQTVDEDWQKALAVVAHPDDLEFGCAAAIARWTAQGKEIVYCLLTSGEAGIDGLAPAESGPLREAEQIESSRIVGVSAVEFLGQPDGTIEYGVPLRRAIAEVIRRHRPEIVLTNNFRDTWDGDVVLNQADHIATGRATLDAVRDAANRWIFPDAGEKWGGVKQVWAAGSPNSRHAVDTTDTFAVGVDSLKAHKAYIDGLNWPHFDPEEFLEGVSRPTGAALGTKYGTRFEVFTV